MYGFLDGPHGVMEGHYRELTAEYIHEFRGQGGFHMIGSGRHKVETPAQFASAARHCTELGLDGLVVIGGDDSNTNAALLAEYFRAEGLATRVVGCPKTIDGDLKSETVEVSFGFDTACKTYSQLIGNMALDSLSSRKYHRFVRLMGRSASHITLECALQTGPNMALIGEEVEAEQQTLKSITTKIADMVCDRWRAGKDYSLTIVPEGLVEFVPEMHVLISELNDLLDAHPAGAPLPLSQPSQALFDLLPDGIRQQLLLERDPHGNVQVSRIETETLLIQMTAAELKRRKALGTYGGSFQALGHFFGYEGRSGLPSAFDSEYGYSLGTAAGALLLAGATGYMASVRGVAGPVREWRAGGVPLTSLMVMEKRHGKMKPVILKALVDLKGRPMQVFREVRDSWRVEDRYRNPGPIQFQGAARDIRPYCLLYEQGWDALPEHRPPASSAPPSPGGKPSRFGPRREVHRYSELEVERLRSPVALPDLLSVPVLQLKPPVDSFAAHSSVRRSFPRSAALPLQSLHHPAPHEPQTSYEAPQPLRIGVAFMGRQCPGGHNVVVGIHERAPRGSVVVGFLGGSEGIVGRQCVELTRDTLSAYFANQGGFDLLGRTSDSLGSPERLRAAQATCESLALDGLVLIGGAKTVADALSVSEHFAEHGSRTKVVVVPATVNGDLCPDYVEASIGFDTACSVYAELIGNMAADAASAKKYYYFIRLMGRITSHVTLEAALQTRPNVTILGEEVAANAMSLDSVTRVIADAVCERKAKCNKNYGVVLIPEGVVNLLPEVSALLEALSGVKAVSDAEARKALESSPWLAALYGSLPLAVRLQLLTEREADGSAMLSHIDTEKLLMSTVEKELARRAALGLYDGKFAALGSFFGYEARCSLPSIFDCSLATSLGHVAVVLVQKGCSGYAANATGLAGPIAKWKLGGVPLARLVVPGHAGKAEFMVDLMGRPARTLFKNRQAWLLADSLTNPGPLQFSRSAEARRTETLAQMRTPGSRGAMIEGICLGARHLIALATDEIPAGPEVDAELRSILEGLDLIAKRLTAVCKQ